MTARLEVLGIPLTDESIDLVSDPSAVVGTDCLVTFVNPQACALDRAHDDYVALLARFDHVLADGAAMAWAARRLTGKAVQRQSFDMTSLAPPVLQCAAGKGLPVVLVGGKPGVAARACEVLEAEFPGLALARHFAGFGPDPEAARAWLLQNPGGLVICGMGAPLQERFVLGLRDAGWQGTAFTCGGFFDQLGGGAHYYPRWIDRWNLRAPYRLAREPRRLWRRYLVDYQEFFRRLAKARAHGG